ncbi:MAG: DUF2470 domain-containing protein [Burkholderiaceae bacterium]
MTSKEPLHQPIDDKARALARRLVRTARFGALAVLEPDGGHPYASRAAVAPDIDGVPVMLLSSLSPHTAALDADPRCTLLLGEPGRGDPLAHPRLSVVGLARRLLRDSEEDARVRGRFLARHPKAERYAGFDDFAFFRLEPQRAVLVGGFGRAFELGRDDVLGGAMLGGADLVAGTPEPAVSVALLAALAAYERTAVEHMNEDHADAVALYATRLCRAQAGDWRLVSVDPYGIDMTSGERIERLEFDAPLAEAAQLRKLLVELAGRARAAHPPQVDGG